MGIKGRFHHGFDCRVSVSLSQKPSSHGRPSLWSGDSGRSVGKMMNLDLKIPKQSERLRLASAGLPVKQLREALHPCICDSCGALLLGTRFKCVECSDFDLCAGCLRSGCLAQRASPEWSHRDTHTLVVLRRITDTTQLSRAFRLAEFLQTAEESEVRAPGSIRNAPVP